MFSGKRKIFLNYRNKNHKWKDKCDYIKIMNYFFSKIPDKEWYKIITRKKNWNIKCQRIQTQNILKPLCIKKENAIKKWASDKNKQFTLVQTWLPN